MSPFSTDSVPARSGRGKTERSAIPIGRPASDAKAVLSVEQLWRRARFWPVRVGISEIVSWLAVLQ